MMNTTSDPSSVSGSSGDNPVQRLANLEMLVTHLQRDMEALSETVVNQQKQLELLDRLIRKLDLRIDQAFQEPEVRDPLQERPPHY